MDFEFEEEMMEFREIQEASLFKYNYSNNQLDSILKNYKKDELIELKDCLELECSNNLKKQDLSKKIVEGIPFTLVEFFEYFNLSHYEFLKPFLNSKQDYLPYDRSQHKIQMIAFLSNIGIIVPMLKDNDKILVMPIEIKDLLQELIRKFEFLTLFKQNTELLTLLYGYANLYGVFELDKVEPFNSFDHERLAHTAHIINFDSVFNFRIDFEEGLVYNIELEEFLDEINSRMNHSFSYYPFTKEEVIKASVNGYIEENEQTTKLKNLIKFEFNVDKDEINMFAVTIINLVKMGYEANEILDFMEEEEGKLPLNFRTELIQIIKLLDQSSRKYTLKGHRQVEASKDNVSSKFIKFVPKR